LILPSGNPTGTLASATDLQGLSALSRRRGIGLIPKLQAYALQDAGADTVEANERLGFPADLREYGVGAQILLDLGVERLRLLTNNPRKVAGLEGFGLTIVAREPLHVGETEHNARYLATKTERLGHLPD
jgi:3,4-dihydroxy 2-butanone 4-phosphate synthase/GTP cyclohydrolase II